MRARDPEPHDTALPAALPAAWAAFDRAAETAGALEIKALFEAEPDRARRFTIEAAGLLLDLSKQPWSEETLAAALALARAADVEGARARLFGGEAVNVSEGRAVLHPALRSRTRAYAAKGEDVSAAVRAGWAKMKALADGVRSGAIAGAEGAPFRTVVHIGIGGSDLGPRLLWEALKPLQPAVDLRFAANVDGSEIAAVLAGLDPATTLVIAVSKTFTTLETLANAEAARDWLRASLGEEAARAHFAAVSAAPDKAVAFGVDADRVFAFWDWVGGRFSLWSAVGLSCAIALGWNVFERVLVGAEAMDEHFLTAPLEANAPALLALAQVLNRDGLGRGARAVAPYAQRLRLLPAFLQQLEMESNGKRARQDGRPVRCAAAPVVFGDAGTNGQHAFFQLLHQGTDVIPVEFVAVAKADEGPPGMHAKLLSNAIAQAEALMIGRPEAEVRADLAGKGLAEAEIDALAPQKTFPGNRPSSFILLERLTPEALGALLALYEHKVFVEGVIWGLNSFDQWGVELGKTLATRILGELEGGAPAPHDPSTAALIARLKA
jgi:glucose-6-phosphate isomerase